MSYGANLYLVELAVVVENDLELTRFEVINNIINGTKYNYRSVPIGKDGKANKVYFFADIREWQDPRNLSSDEIKLVFPEGFK